MADTNYWTWSPQHQDHFHAKLLPDGTWDYQWANGAPRHDSVTGSPPKAQANPNEVLQLPAGAIRGTPGKDEELDSSYKLRQESFFEEGRLFSVLFSEPYGETAKNLGNDDNVSVVIYGGKVYTQIRRFVVVSKQRGFSYAWWVMRALYRPQCLREYGRSPIFTYQGQGTTKKGVSPQQHAIIYMTTAAPTPVPGETPLRKRAIGVIPARADITLTRASRINFGLHHPIQHNLKVKDLGRVQEADRSNLIAYWEQERGY